MDVDVIGQGREPKREYRLSSRRWRVAGWSAAVLAGIAVFGVGLRFGAGSPGAAAVTVVPTAAAPLVPGWKLPLPQPHPPAAVCSPSSGTCSMRIFVYAH